MRAQALSRRAFRSLLLPAAAICGSAAAGLLIVSWTALRDLDDLTPKMDRTDGYALLGWGDLRRSGHALQQGGLSGGTPLRALGYMMEGDEPLFEGQRTAKFVLLPDAGNAIHPAHRWGDQMIDVRLGSGEAVRFCPRCLVWVWGALRVLPGDPAGPRPLYRLDGARIEPARPDEIRKYFR